MRRSTLIAGISMLLVGFLTVSASADTISLDFATGADPGAGGSNPSDTMAPGTSAGAVFVPHWNNLYLANGTLGSLVNSAGAITTASATWASNGTYATGNPDNTGNYQMMNTEIDERASGPFVGANPATVTVSGLSGPGVYDVYVYYNAVTVPNTVHAAYTIGSTTYYTSNNTFDGTTFTRETNTTPGGPYTAGANFVEFLDVTGSSFTLIDSAESFRGEINGIQIVGVPEPSSLVALCGLGLAGLFVAVRRRRKS
jgi:hypothetical protein